MPPTPPEPRRILGSRRPLRLLLVAAALLTLGAAPEVAPDIRKTKHNLARHGTVADANTLCVYCHTPQTAPDTPPTRPRWQPSVPDGEQFSTVDPLARAAGLASREAAGSQSLVCLSCHDGTQAPGLLGSNSDHPFGIPFRGPLSWRVAADKDPLQGTPGSRELRDPGSYVKPDFRGAVSGVIGGQNAWWVPTQTFSARRSKNDIPLYLRHTVDGLEIPHVECSSCHDPHNDQETFLRMSNDQSRLCLSCHDK